MGHSPTALFLGVVVAASTLVAGEPSQPPRAAAASQRVARYQLQRFKTVGPVPACEQTRPSTATAPARHIPTARRIQHTEPSEVPPLPPSFELAQADLLDDLLETPAESQPPATDEGDILDEMILPEPATTAAESETPPPTPPARSAPATPSAAATTPATKSTAAPPAAAPPAAVAGPEPWHVSPAPTQPTPGLQAIPMDQRRHRANQPYTLGGILDDDEDPTECLCEQMFCQQMWQCAGGRNNCRLARWRRDFQRNLGAFMGQANRSPNPMKNWECPYRQRGGTQGPNGSCQDCQSGPGHYETDWGNVPEGSPPVSEGVWGPNGIPVESGMASEPIPEPAYLHID